LTPNIAIIFEKLILNNLQSFVFENNILPICQYGFIPGLSVEHQIIELMRDVSEMLNIKELICIDIIFIDAENAFDSVPHNELLKERKSIGIFGIF